MPLSIAARHALSQTKVLLNIEGERSLEEVLKRDVEKLITLVDALNKLEDDGTELSADELIQLKTLGPELEAKEEQLAKTQATILALRKTAVVKKLHASEYDASTPRPAAARAGAPEVMPAHDGSVVVAQLEAQPEAATTAKQPQKAKQSHKKKKKNKGKNGSKS